MPEVTPERPRTGKGKYVRSPETAERDAEAARLRARGWSLQRIADHFEVHKSSVAAMVERALAAIVQEPAEAVRRMELERLEEMYDAATAVLERRHVTVSNGRIIVLDGEPLQDDGPVLQAIDRLLKIQERRARLLGLDAASKTEVSGGVRYEIVGIDMDKLQ